MWSMSVLCVMGLDHFANGEMRHQLILILTLPSLTCSCSLENIKRSRIEFFWKIDPSWADYLVGVKIFLHLIEIYVHYHHNQLWLWKKEKRAQGQVWLCFEIMRQHWWGVKVYYSWYSGQLPICQINSVLFVLKYNFYYIYAIKYQVRYSKWRVECMKSVSLWLLLSQAKVSRSVTFGCP